MGCKLKSYIKILEASLKAQGMTLLPFLLFVSWNVDIMVGAPAAILDREGKINHFA